MSDEQKYQEEKIKELLAELNSTFSNILFRKQFSELDNISNEIYEEISNLKDSFSLYADNLYVIVVAYLENKGVKNFLTKFEKSIAPYYQDVNKLFDSKFDDLSGECYSLLVSEYWKYLCAFPAFNVIGYDQILKRTGLIYLENILESTSVILKELNILPNSETEITKYVRIVIKAVFHNIPKSNIPFQQIAKYYKPDILIPSLNCAIEYKYAETETRLIETIDQILIDVNGYDKHPIYKLFYAVFYVKSGIWPKQRFDEVWAEKKFPKNWRGIIIQGF